MIRPGAIRLRLRYTKFSRSPWPLLSGGVPATQALKLILKSTYDQWSEDNGPRLAAALAYYALFCLAPLLMIVMAVAGLALGQQSVRVALMAYTYGLVGSAGAQAIQEILQDIHKPVVGTLAGAVGVLLLLIGASGVFSELQNALSTIWHVKSQCSGRWRLVRDHCMSFGMVLASGLLLVISLLLTTILAAVGKFASNQLPGSEAALHLVGTLVSLTITTLLFAMIFKLLPGTPIAWRDVWVPAAATAIMFDLGKLLIAFYLGKSIWASAYGAASSLMIVTAWVYYSAWILYFGAEFAKVYAGMHGSQAGSNRSPHLSRSNEPGP